MGNGGFAGSRDSREKHDPVRDFLSVATPVHDGLNEFRSSALQAGTCQIIMSNVRKAEFLKDPGISF